jgi:hypothetical protein
MPVDKEKSAADPIVSADPARASPLSRLHEVAAFA